MLRRNNIIFANGKLGDDLDFQWVTHSVRVATDRERLASKLEQASSRRPFIGALYAAAVRFSCSSIYSEHQRTVV